MGKMGQVLARQGHRDKARVHFASALADAERLRIPEAEIIRAALEALDAAEAG